MKKKILITGAGGGFGKLFVQTLLNNGHEVAGTLRDINGRNKAVSDELTSAGAEIIEMDVTNDDSVEKGVAQAIEVLGGLDIVVNNAGVGVLGIQEQFTPEDLQKVFDINVIGVHRVNRAALPFLRKQGKGSLIHVSSLLGRITIPFYGPYNATKWALEALSENYRVELSGFGIEVSILEPGGYPTAFMDNLIKPSDHSRDESFGEFAQAPQGFFEGFEANLANNPGQNPQLVADALLKVVNTAHGERPFRTTIDTLGMGEHVDNANQLSDQITNGIFTAFGIDGMLKVNTAEAVS